MGRKRRGKPVSLVMEGPTSDRLKRSEGYFTPGGEGRNRRFTMMDDNLGRLLLRKNISQQQYSALQRYAVHWYAAGFAGALSTFDLDRIRAANPSAMGGLARNEKELNHKQIYRSARIAIGEEPAHVADLVACRDYPLMTVGALMGFASQSRGRARAGQLLLEAADQLDGFWQRFDRRPR